MKMNKFMKLMGHCGLICLLSLSFSSVAQACSSACKKNTVSASKKCCTSVKARFKNRNKDYCAGFRAAQSYVEGVPQGVKCSKSWNEGFTDGRFNVYYSCSSEIQVEKATCTSCPCS